MKEYNIPSGMRGQGGQKTVGGKPPTSRKPTPTPTPTPPIVPAAPVPSPAATPTPSTRGGGQPPTQASVVSKQKPPAKWKPILGWIGCGVLIAFVIIGIVSYFGMKAAREAAEAEMAALAATAEAEALAEAEAETVVSDDGEQILDSDVSFVGEETAPIGVMESDGSVSLDPNVTFVVPETALVQIQTTSVVKSSKGVTIHFRWVVAPEGEFSLIGEIWDRWIPNQEIMLTFAVAEGDTGTVVVPVTSWDNVSHAQIVASGPSQQWEASGEFTLVE